MLKDVTLGQYFPGETAVHKMDPRTKLVLVIVYIVALFLAVPYLQKQSKSSFSRAKKRGQKEAIGQ